jgi:hypothetical protein
MILRRSVVKRWISGRAILLSTPVVLPFCTGVVDNPAAEMLATAETAAASMEPY